jgi:hypothetical protein
LVREEENSLDPGELLRLLEERDHHSVYGSDKGTNQGEKVQGLLMSLYQYILMLMSYFNVNEHVSIDFNVDEHASID